MLGRSQWPSGIRRGSAADRFLGLRVRIPSKAWLSVSCECCVLLGRRFCDEPLTLLGESYIPCCVIVFDLETSRIRRPWPALGCCTTYIYIYNIRAEVVLTTLRKTNRKHAQFHYKHDRLKLSEKCTKSLYSVKTSKDIVSQTQNYVNIKANGTYI